jgi:hypothetical protein
MFHTFICSRRMLLVFYLNVTKIDLDVTYTCMLQAYVLSVIRYFIWTLHMFAVGFKCFSDVFAFVFIHLFQVFHLSSFAWCNYCIWMFQKWIGVLHMRCAWEATGGARDIRGGVGDVRGDTGPLRVHSLVSPTHYALAHSLYGHRSSANVWIGHLDASKPKYDFSYLSCQPFVYSLFTPYSLLYKISFPYSVIPFFTKYHF